MSRVSNEVLVQMYQLGDQEALERLIAQNRKLIYKVVNMYQTYGTNSIDKEDLFQEGCMGLMMAAYKYDFLAEHKCSFGTYAFHWIRSKVGRFVQSYNTCMECSLDEPISAKDEELTRMDQLVGHDGDMCYECLESREEREEIDKLIKENLTLQEGEVIKCRYGFYGNIVTLEDTGELLGINNSNVKEKVRTIEMKSLKKLRKTEYAQQYMMEKYMQYKTSLERRGTERAALYMISEMERLEQFLIDTRDIHRKCYQ